MATAVDAENEVRTDAYNNVYRQYFQYKYYNFVPSDDALGSEDKNIINPVPVKILPSIDPITENIKDRGNIERSYDYNYVKPYLIKPLFDFFTKSESDILFHYYMKYNSEALKNNFSFLKSLLYIFSNLIKNLSIDISIELNGVNIEADDIIKDKMQEFLFNNYFNKRIDGIEINNEYIYFNLIDIKDITSSTLLYSKLVDDDNINHSGKTFNRYLLMLYKYGFFNFYNHIIDVINECTTFSEKKVNYYCNRLKIGAVKILQYYIISDILKFFILARKNNKIVSLSTNRIYIEGDSVYDCDSQFETDDLDLTEENLNILKQDIVKYWQIQDILVSKINTEDGLIQLKDFKSLQIFDVISDNNNDINKINQKNENTDNIVRTLTEKNVTSNVILKNNKIKLILFGIMVLCYIIINITILFNLVKIPTHTILLLNSIILIIMIIYIFINILKKIYF
jgi:hypothetical protein